RRRLDQGLAAATGVTATAGKVDLGQRCRCHAVHDFHVAPCGDWNSPCDFANDRRENAMRKDRHLVKSTTIAGVAVSALLGLAGVTFSSAPAGAVIYCTYIGYPANCIVRPGVVLRPRPVARAAVRAGTVGANVNGGVNRVGIR